MSRTGSPWLKLFDVLEVTGGRLWDPMPSGTEPHFSGCAIDSRALEGGELFIPLPGSHADGHDFIAAALKGAAGGSLIRAGRASSAEWPRAGKPVRPSRRWGGTAGTAFRFPSSR